MDLAPDPRIPTDVLERYRHAVMMRSRSEDLWRTSVWCWDQGQCWYSWQDWKHEADAALAAVRACL